MIVESRIGKQDVEIVDAYSVEEIDEFFWPIHGVADGKHAEWNAPRLQLA
jgi:hypothetical protein